MEAIVARINIQVEMGVVEIEQSENQEVEQLQKFTLRSMRVDICLILKSLEVKSRTVVSQLIELLGESDYLIANKRLGLRAYY